jgi:hypothetical protein
MKKDYNDIDSLVADIAKELHNSIEGSAILIGKLSVLRIKQQITAQKLIASSGMLESFEYKVNKAVDNYIISVFSNSPYAYFVDKGSKAHMPPVQSIAKWLMLKKESLSFVVNNKTVNKFAWAIAKTISRKGIKATKFFQIATKDVTKIVDKILAEAV